MTLLIIGLFLVKWSCFNLTMKRKETYMEQVNKVNEANKLVLLEIIDTTWEIGTSVAANSAQF
jgi:hypothetical protein